jgi:hypothetical protein
MDIFAREEMQLPDLFAKKEKVIRNEVNYRNN